MKILNRTTANQPQTRPVKVMQFGKGNFLRAFAEWMVDIANEKKNFNGAVQMVQVNSQETDQRFNDQQGLYHVVLNGMRHGKSVNETRLITCVDALINPFEDYQAYLRTGENPDLAFIISNTTEAGIRFHEDDRTPDTLSRTFPGKLTALLYHRYRFFNGNADKALTILPCELIEKNGEALRETILQYSAHWKLEDGFRNWITNHTLFCNSLVDRIVPGLPKETLAEIWSSTGYEDQLVVSAEPFHLWVIEPKFVPGRSLQQLQRDLPFEVAGLNVKFVDDLTPYRSSKVRILNGAHTAMVPVGYLRGLRTVKEAIDDPYTGTFIRGAIAEEVIPTLDLPAAELEQFAADTIERFQNPFIRHELKAIALNAVSKYQVRVLPTVLEYHHRTGKLPEKLLFALAALILFYKGEWRGEPVPLNDTPAVLEFFKSAWQLSDYASVTQQVLSNTELWKADLTKINGLKDAVEQHMRLIGSW